MSKVNEILEKRAQELEAQIAPLKTELNQIRVAQRAIKDAEQPNIAPIRPFEPKRTVGALIRTILETNPDGLPMGAIADALLIDHKRMVARRDVSWNLSKLKRDGVLELDGELWRLAGS